MLEWFNFEADNLLVASQYDLALVVLSIAIAILSAFMGFQVASQSVAKASSLRRHLTLFTASVALGVGVWSMHFIGMLALELCTPVTYEWKLTGISLLPSVGASWVALRTLSFSKISLRQILFSGVLMGGGIGTMHYVGMAAMEMAPLLRYDLGMFVLSIFVAAALAILALWIRFGLLRMQLWSGRTLIVNGVASVVMGFAISGMHYTGMAAARFVRPPGLELTDQPSELSFLLAMAVAIATITMTGLVLGTNLLLSYRDVSREAKANERRLLAMMDTAVDGIVSIDEHGTVLECNRAVEHILGWQRDELVGKNVTTLMPESLQKQHDGFIANYLKTGIGKIIGDGRDVIARHKLGEDIPVRLAIGHLRQGQQHFFIGFITDLRNRLKMEQALRLNEARFRSLVTNIPGIAYRCLNQDGWPMVYISDAVEEITGYPASDFLLPNPSRSFIDLFHPEDRHLAEEIYQEQQSFSLEYRIKRSDGETRWLLEQGVCVRDEDSQQVWMDGFIMDITARKKMETELILSRDEARQAASARAAFLANMSHEIRTPMNAIIGFSDILLTSKLDDSQHKQLSTINRSAKSLLHLLNDVLDSAKLDKGKLELETRSFLLTDEIDTVISTLWLQAKSKNLELTFHIDNNINPHRTGSPERLRQVLLNLVGNAVKFTQEGQVSLDVKILDGDQVLFEIRDTGIGMTPEQLDKVFDAFSQADASMSRRFGGTGLGTTISKQLVELMGGRIWADSEPDKGSTFSFAIPLPECDTAYQPTDLSNVELPPMDILVVDDIAQNVDLLEAILCSHGHSVRSASDGAQALTAMHEQKPDVVLMDLQMPVMDGLTAARERRKAEQGQNLPVIPIIALTASVLEEDRISAREAGMQGFAGKPVDIHALFNEIAKVTGRAYSEEATSQSKDKLRLIDEERGIKMWGSKERYYDELAKFIEPCRTMLTNLQTHLQQQDRQKVLDVIHSLKGLTGNLGLMQWFSTLGTMDNNLRQGLPLEDVSDECTSLLDSYSQVKDYVERAKATAPEKPDAESLPLPRLLSFVEALLEGVRHNTYDEQVLQQLMSGCGNGFADKVSHISQLLDDFEFEKAQTLLEQLQENLQRHDS